MRSWMRCGLCAAVVGFLSVGVVQGQPPREQPEPGRPGAPESSGVPQPNRPRIPGPDQPGPWDQDVLVYRASATGARARKIMAGWGRTVFKAVWRSNLRKVKRGRRQEKTVPVRLHYQALFLAAYTLLF